jgi:uncharacterized protein DUF6868
MDIKVLQDLFFWCMLVNIGIYTFTAISVLLIRDITVNIHVKLFGIDKETVKKSIYMYLAAYKLLIIVFNFVPWAVILNIT